MPLLRFPNWLRFGSARKKPQVIRENKAVNTSPVKPKSPTKPPTHNFSEKSNHTYAEGVVGAKRTMALCHLNVPHLILHDASGKQRVALGYKLEGNKLVIYALQRERTAYDFSGQQPVWSRRLEQIESKKFRSELGFHPSEFLLREFIRRNKELILQNSLYLQIMDTEQNRKIYGPLVERFFGKQAEKVGMNQIRYEVSLKKQRVQELLGLKKGQK